MILAMLQLSGKMPFTRVLSKSVKRGLMTEEAVCKKYGGIWSCPTDFLMIICVKLGMSRNIKDDKIRFVK